MVEHFEAYRTCFEEISSIFDAIIESEVIIPEDVEAFNNAILAFKESSAILHQTMNDALTNISETQANAIVEQAKEEIQAEIIGVSDALDSLEQTMNGEFKSGLISTMNLTTLRSKLSQLETEKADVDGQYKGLIDNPKLGSTSRTNLANAKGELDTAHDQLVAKINSAVADNLMTEAELEEINRLITQYAQALKVYSEVAQQCNADIALNLAQGAIAALNQEDIFNKLTNNGEVQGIYLQDGKVYINGEYINSRNLKAVRNDGTETFKIDSEGNVHLRAATFYLVGDGGTSTNIPTKDEVYNKEEVDNKFQEIEERHMYRIEIHSTNGVIFKNGIINTTLTVRLYNWDKEITDEVDETRFIWTRVSSDEAGDTVWNNQHAIGSKSIKITSADVRARATFNVDFVDENGQSLL